MLRSNARFLRWQLATLLLVLPTMLATPWPSWAGSIGFRVDTTVRTSDRVEVAVKLTHTGDETASDVFPIVELNHRQAKGAVASSFAASSSREWVLDLGPAGFPTGVYAAVIRVNYADLNGYPFQVVSVAPVQMGMAAASPIQGHLRVPAIPENGSGKATLTLDSVERRSGRFRVEIAVPAGIAASTETFEIDLAGTDGASRNNRRDVVLTNRNLLVGTSVNVYALVTNLDGGPPQTDRIQAVVRIIKPRELLTTSLLMQVGGMLTVLLLLLETATVRRPG